MTATNQGTPQSTSLDANLRIEWAEGRIIGKIDGIDRLLITPDVIKLSAPGIDVKTATDDQLVWSSNFKNLKIIGTGSFVWRSVDFYTIGGGAYFGYGASKTIPLSRLKAPVVLAFVEFPGGIGGPAHPLPHTLFGFTTGAVSSYIEHSALPTGVTFEMRSTTLPGGVAGVPIRYYIFEETATAA